MNEDRCGLLCLDLDQAETLRQRRLSREAAELAAARAAALGDATRLGLAAALADADEVCVCDLSWIAERAQNLVGHHLRALRTAGLVRSRREGKMVLYRLTEEGRQLLEVVLAAEGRPAR